MIQTLRISFIALVLATLSACGGGGGGLNVNVNIAGGDPPLLQTKATAITVIDGYIQGAIVCVDKNKNGSCDTGETQGKTGADGKVVLNIPLDDVGKYPIVAYVPADAIDKDDGKAVGTAFTLIAPAGSSTLVTPLTTLVQHLMVNGGKSSADASAQIKQAIGDPSVDYIANAQAAQTRVAAKILAKLIQNLPASVSGQTDAQKTTALYTILMNALPEVQAQAQTLVTASACSESITSTDCQSSVSVAATAMKDSGKLNTAFQDWNANRRPITKDLQTPNVLDTVTFSVSNLHSAINSVEWDLGDGKGIQTSTISNSASTISTRYPSPGSKAITLSYKNSAGTVLTTDTLRLQVAPGTVSQTASISSASNSGTTIANGGRSDGLVLGLSGTYSAALGSDYSIHVLDGSTDIGTASANDSAKTWSFTTGPLTAGSHDFKAVVLRNSDSLQGTPSAAYTVKLGNSIASSTGVNGSNNVLDTITLSLSNLWNTVKSVVFSITDSPSSNIGQSDLADGQTSKTINAPNSGAWQTISTAFKTAGSKVISLVFKDGAGTTLDSTSITLSVGQGSVSQKASISSIQDHGTPTPTEIAAGQATKDTKPLISGTVDTALNEFYDVAVFDNGNKLSGQLSYTNNKKDWSFSPANALSQGEHAFTAAVVRIDAAQGVLSSERKALVLTAVPTVDLSNPNVLDNVRFSVSNMYSAINSVEWDLGDGKGIQTSTISNSASTISTRYPSPGSKAITLSYKNSAGTVLTTDTLRLQVAPGTVSQTASISSASNSGTTIANGGRSDGLVLGLSGTYSAALGSDYSIHVLDGSTDIGTASANDSAKTWSFTTGPLTAGSHDFKAVVLRNSDSLQGTPSAAYTVKLGNSIASSTGVNGSNNVLDTITLSLSNLWNTVKSVVFSITDSPSSNIGQSDLADGQTSKTINAPNSGAWQTISTAFKTAGSKVISLVFKDGAGTTLDSTSITLSVGQGSVSQKASISSIQDHGTPTPTEIAAGQATKDTKPLISGTVDTALNEFYDVAVFDNGNKLSGQLSYTNNKKDWSFSPANALSQGEHAVTARVVRIDGVEGAKGNERQFVLQLSNIGFSPENPQLGLPISFSASNVWSGITTVLWNFGDGVTFRDFTYQGRSSVQHTFAESSGVGNKTVTLSYLDNTGKTVDSEQIVLNLGAPPVVAQTATITAIKDGNNILQSGDWASSNLLSLQGTYQGELGSGFTVEIIVDGTDWDTASIDPATHTWTYTKRMPWYGLLNIQAVVKQRIQTGPFAYIYKEYFGVYSDPFKVKIGNKLSPSSTQPNAWDEWVLTFSNVWNNVRSIVITFAGNALDLIDGLITQTLGNIDPFARNPYWSIATGFKTAGDKTFNIEYRDSSGLAVATDTLRTVVADAGSVTQIPTIDSVIDSSNSAVAKNGVTTAAVKTVQGSINAAIGKFYHVEVYDNGSLTALPGFMAYNAARTTWEFSPNAPLAPGVHVLTAAVVRGDALAGSRSASSWTVTVVTPRFTKIGSNGQPLANQYGAWSDAGNEADGTQWDCILEEDTGRMWEVKSKKANSVRNVNFTYLYYIPNPRTLGAATGSETLGPCIDRNDGNCYVPDGPGSNGVYLGATCKFLPDTNKCNTQSYIDTVNSAGLCGKSDWRLPTPDEAVRKVSGFSSLYFPNIKPFWVEVKNSSLEVFDPGILVEPTFYYGGLDPAYSITLTRITPRGPGQITQAVAPTASITGALSLGAYSGPQWLVLGNYSNDFVTADYSVMVMVDGADIGTASLGQPGKWSFTTPNLTPGNHSISAVVVRKSDGIKGTPSAGYGITVR